MNNKNISKHLSQVHNNFVNSIKDKKVQELVSKNSIITGGAITSLLIKEEVNDYDYYFTDLDTCLAVTEYYISQYNKRNKTNIIARIKDGSIFLDFRTNEDNKNMCQGIFEEGLISNKISKKDKYFPIYITPNAITLTDKIQIITRFYGDAKQIHENFDFVHCTNYWVSSTKEVVFNQKALESIMNKELIYTGSKYPLCSIFRTRKFITRGWTINAGQYVKMALQLNKLNLYDVGVLQDQLIGVDTTHFRELIRRISTEQENNKEFIIDEIFISNIIDEIF